MPRRVTLKRCPVCRGKAKMDSLSPASKMNYFVSCLRCGYWITGYYCSPSYAAKKWNTRGGRSKFPGGGYRK